MAIASAREQGSREWGLVLVQGIATLVLGLLLVISPGMTTAVLVTFLGAYWLIRGIIAIAEIFTGSSGVSWGWLLFLGVLGVIAGLAVLRHPLYSAILVPAIIVVLLGIDAVIMGIVNVFRGFTGSGGWTFVLGIVDVLIGAVLLASPITGALVLPVVVGAFMIIGGIALTVYAVGARSSGEELDTTMRRVA